MNSCEEYQELISRLADGELSADEEAKLRAHMETCPQCRKLYAAFTAISSAAAEELEAPPEDMKDNIMSAVKSARGKVVPIRHWKTWLAAAACFALVLAGAAGTGLFSPKGGAVPTASPAMYKQSDAAAESISPDVSAETDKTISTNDAISGSGASGNTAGTPDAADSPEKAAASAPSVPPVVKATAGSANTKAVCVTGPEGGSCVTDADTISKLDAVLEKADPQPVSSSGYDGELTSSAAADAYTVEYPDGRTLTVTIDGDAVYCTDASTGETYLATGSAADFQTVLSQFTAG